MRRLPPPSGRSAAYAQLWRMVDGAIIDALRMHPDYLSQRGRYRDTARRSIVKRVTGSLMGFLVEAERGRAVLLGGVADQGVGGHFAAAATADATSSAGGSRDSESRP